jgi:transposase-like protein
VSLTAGTRLQGSKVPVRIWLAACWHLTQTKTGISATAFASMYGLPYNSTWLLFHKIRSAMDQAGKDRLSGRIEIDETMIGGYAPAISGNRTKKVPVAVAVEFTKTSLGRARMARLPSNSRSSLAQFIKDNIEPGSILFSDGNQTYRSAVLDLHNEGLDYQLSQLNQTAADLHPKEMMTKVHLVISLYRRQQLGTFHGGTADHNLDPYLSEFVFRFNRRRSRSRGRLFWGLVTALCDTTGPVRYRDLRGRSEEMAAADKAAAALDRKRAKAAHAAVEKHSYASRKAKERGLPAPANPAELPPELTHDEPLDPF